MIPPMTAPFTVPVSFLMMMKRTRRTMPIRTAHSSPRIRDSSSVTTKPMIIDFFSSSGDEESVKVHDEPCWLPGPGDV